MRWKNHKKTQMLLWTSFIYALFIIMFLSTNVSYALPQTAVNNPISPLTEQQLVSILSKYDANKSSSLPPKINGKDIFLNPSVSQLNPQSNNSTNPSSTSRCLYNGQNYVIGDIVNTELGWLRCTQSFFFSTANPTIAQYGESTWMKVQ